MEKIYSNIRSERILDIAKRIGIELTPRARVLDLGCGAGGIVQSMLERGIQAFGCDLDFKSEAHVKTDDLYKKDILRLINLEPYKLPFPDNYFDLVISDTVMEHVMNTKEFMSELSRVMKADGECLHFLPSRYRVIEGHTFVPFASINRSLPWLLFWAILGIRKQSQKGQSALSVAKENREYLINNTIYLRKLELQNIFKEQFKCVRFHEKEFLESTARGKLLRKFGMINIVTIALYRNFKSRVVYGRSPY